MPGVRIPLRFSFSKTGLASLKPGQSPTCLLLASSQHGCSGYTSFHSNLRLQKWIPQEAMLTLHGLFWPSLQSQAVSPLEACCWIWVSHRPAKVQGEKTGTPPRKACGWKRLFWPQLPSILLSHHNFIFSHPETFGIPQRLGQRPAGWRSWLLEQDESYIHSTMGHLLHASPTLRSYILYLIQSSWQTVIRVHSYLISQRLGELTLPHPSSESQYKAAWIWTHPLKNRVDWLPPEEKMKWGGACVCSGAQSCLTLCDPMNCSTPGFPVHYQPPELAQTHVHKLLMSSNAASLKWGGLDIKNRYQKLFTEGAIP